MHLRCVRLCECPTTSGNSTMPGEQSVDEHPPVSSTTVSITHPVHHVRRYFRVLDEVARKRRLQTPDRVIPWTVHWFCRADQFL